LFFAFSKTLGIMLLPINLLIVLGLLGVLLLLTRWARLGRALLVASALLLALCGFTPVGSLLMYPLESRFPPWDASRGAPDGIVVLGGAIDPDPAAAHGEAAYSSSAGRIISAAMLAHRFPNARILYSGGSANFLSDTSAKEADYAVKVFEGLGIAKERLIIERESRNTFENAEFSKKLADPKPGERWLLLTSAFHMPRSIGIFRKVGFAVEPCPVDWRLAGRRDLTHFPAQSEEGLQHTNLAVREWLGLIAYRLTGRTDELFPGPTSTN
jgi:uncharacterized SAM-binding protein YcdF (DUF218 family)